MSRRELVQNDNAMLVRMYNWMNEPAPNGRGSNFPADVPGFMEINEDLHGRINALEQAVSASAVDIVNADAVGWITDLFGTGPWQISALKLPFDTLNLTNLGGDAEDAWDPLGAG